MRKSSKPSLSPKERKKNKIGYIIILLIIVSFIGLYFYKNKNQQLKESSIYYTGNIYSANHAANMLDYLDEGDNILLSPFNVNSSLAVLYNGTDNNSNKEIKKYFKRNIDEINEEMSTKISSLKEEEKTKNKYNQLYESYIKELYDNSYNTLTTSTIALLPKEEKEELLLLLKKIQLTHEHLNGKNNLSLDKIKKYKLTSTEYINNDYAIKELLENIISDNESYGIENSVNNYIGIFGNDLNKNNINKEFIQKTSFYNYNITSLDYDTNLEKVQAINEDIKQVTSGGINRIVENHEIDNNDLIITNNLHFYYSWEKAFDRNNVNDAEFYNIDGEVQAVEMMYSIEASYLENKTTKGFVYDFENSKYSFIGILPKKSGDFNLSSINIDSLLLSKKQENVLIGLPKMNYESEINLKELVSHYRIEEIFTTKANFTQINDDQLRISKMTQKNSLLIAEKGTIKSSLRQTETSTYDESMYNEQIILNRPYAFLIRNNETGDIMFIGKVVRINEGS